ncbi:D-glycero-D-manno-heptose 1-phosphate guanosyltransferase, partial [Campylobacter jejuni]|nr:D-glycero-D-manno-heptose 1-phosphate guanosyltransferase [Campylobacter jejuni]
DIGIPQDYILFCDKHEFYNLFFHV